MLPITFRQLCILILIHAKFHIMQNNSSALNLLNEIQFILVNKVPHVILSVGHVAANMALSTR